MTGTKTNGLKALAGCGDDVHAGRKWVAAGSQCRGSACLWCPAPCSVSLSGHHCTYRRGSTACVRTVPAPTTGTGPSTSSTPTAPPVTRSTRWLPASCTSRRGRVITLVPCRVGPRADQPEPQYWLKPNIFTQSSTNACPH